MVKSRITCSCAKDPCTARVVYTIGTSRARIKSLFALANSVSATSNTTTSIASNMTDLSRCRLLALPREIRDLIYAYLHQSALATEEPRGNESGNLLVLVTCAPLTAVLQLCKQIQSEYLEMVFNHIALRIAVPSDHKIMDGIKLKDGVPSKIFTRAVEILVNVDYVRIDDRLEEESGDELSVYLDGVVSEPEEASVQRQYKG